MTSCQFQMLPRSIGLGPVEIQTISQKMWIYNRFLGAKGPKPRSFFVVCHSDVAIFRSVADFVAASRKGSKPETMQNEK